MKEIKFRFWNKEENKMSLPYELTGELYFHDHEIKLQYTGLKDKNGVEIYEGDIVKDIYLYSPEFSFEQFKKKDVFEANIQSLTEHYANNNYDFDWKKMVEYYGDGFGEYGVEVIGNIYENPELIKE